MKICLKNIGKLYLVSANPDVLFFRGREMREPFMIENAWLLIEDERVIDYGTGEAPRSEDINEIVDCNGNMVLPGFVDSHTHAVFAGTREDELLMKLHGLSYEQITQKGGGILSSVRKLREASEEELLLQSVERLRKMAKMGTTVVEIKSGYGLDFQSEIKMLSVIQKLKAFVPQTIYATFLGAHAVPPEYQSNRKEYIRLITEQMIPYIAREGLADFVDVFCEQGFFTPEEAYQILETATSYGLKTKVHANELHLSGGVQVGVKARATSVDHLECLGDEEIALLKSSDTVATLLPSTAFYLRLNYAPARQLIDNEAIVALASDFNPGTSPSFNLYFVWVLACLQMRMLPEEALTALTLNAAYALRATSFGSLAKGKYANLIVTHSLDNIAKIPYFFGENFIQRVMIKGRWV